MGNAENGAQPQLSKRAQIANPFRAMVFGAMADEMIADGTDVVKLSLGEPDFGAAVRPMCAEAELLSYIDLIDSRMEIYAETLPGVPAGGFSQRIFALEKKIYHHN